MRSNKIKEALSLVHHYEKTEPRPDAVSRAVKVVGLDEKEANILHSVTHTLAGKG